MIGETIAHYRITAKLGEGGMGEVYRATDTRLDRDVAIKIAKEQFSERFEREAHAVAALNHPHICHLYDVGPNYLVMELVEGAPLKGPLSLDKAIEYAGQILDALDAAHKKGITHRDLKPANILVTRQGIKLLDFGLAKQTAPLQETDVTRALTGKGQILGTLQYMSPEQLQGKEVDARSDLFSFGCVLYEMLTGKRAFEGQNPASVIAAILEREPAPLEVARPLDRVVRRSLAKDPDQRFQTARDLKAAMNWALEQLPSPIVAKPIRRLWITAAAVIIGATGGWAISHFRQSPANALVLRFYVEPPDGVKFVFGTNVGGIALSPDGRFAAFVGSGNGKSGLWVRSLEDMTARLFAGTEGASYPFWSPDSRSIAFFTGLGDSLQRLDLAGGAPSKICDLGANGRSGAWSSDGKIVFGTVSSGLFQVPVTGGKPSSLTTPDASHGEVSHRWPQLLPKGRFLYLVQNQQPENSGVYVASLAKPAESVRVLATNTNAVYAPGGDGKDYLLWLRGSTLMAQKFDTENFKLAGEPHRVTDPVAESVAGGQLVAASANGLLLYAASNAVSQLTWLDRSGKPLAVVGDPGAWQTFRLSPDGRRVAASQGRPGGTTDLWLLDVGRSVASRFTSGPSSNQHPVWSPDGRSIVFTGGTPRTVVRQETAATGGEQRLMESRNTIIDSPTDYSHDGRFVLFSESSSATQRDIWVLPMDKAKSEATPYIRSQFSEWMGRFSPDASPRWVAYASNESGRFEVYINTFPKPGRRTLISTNGGDYPAWGPLGKDGRELFYISPEDKLVSVSIKLGTDSVEPSPPRELFPLPGYDNGLGSSYDVTADGQRFLTRFDRASQPLIVIFNWPALMKKGTAAQ
jgi:Tol biopolymer transport system component/predicted Ser/Thr protein kinase